MNRVKIRKLVFGEGRPKICVPITGRTGEEIALRTAELKAAKPDLAEWRADWYEKVFDREKLETMLTWLRKELGELPLLVTFRTREAVSYTHLHLLPGLIFWSSCGCGSWNSG